VSLKDKYQSSASFGCNAVANGTKFELSTSSACACLARILIRNMLVLTKNERKGALSVLNEW